MSDDQTQHKYNLRSKDKDMSDDKSKSKKDVKKCDSSDDDSYNSSSDSEYNDEEEMEVMDEHEYRKFLSKIFPSKHLTDTVKTGEKVKALTSPKSKNKNISKKTGSEEESEEEDSDEDSDYDEEDMFEDEAGKFQIVFTICDNDEFSKAFSEYDDGDDSDSEDSDGSDDSDEDVKAPSKVKSDIKKNMKEEETEDSSGDEAPPKKKRRTQLSKKKVENKKLPSKKKATKDVSNDKKETKKGKDNVNDVNSNDDTNEPTDAFRKMMELIKTNSKTSSDKAFKQMEEFIKQEEEKERKKKEKADEKKKDKNMKKFRKMLRGRETMNDFKFFKEMSVEEQKTIMEKMKDIDKYTSIDKPYRLKLIEAPIPAKYKANAMRKISSLNYMDPGSGEYYKVKQWVDTFMQIPFGVNKTLPLQISDGVEKCNEFMSRSLETLDKAVYGLDDAKMQIMQMMGQWISNPDAVGSAIAIKGPMGTGKTTLVKDGISKILNRPFAFIALGGATDSSFLEGHSYTYEGSIWGKIVDIIIQSKCMNPVIYFDELDKVSDTPKGEEIIGILTHLTDTTQNTQFHDKYFSDIDFDLSKALFIFSYNDEHKVNPILRDRMYRIETKGYDTSEKITIARNYLIPYIEKNISFDKDQINIDDRALKYIIKEYTQQEKGVRNLKRCLEIIYTKLNLFRLMKPNTKLFKDVETFEVTFPFNLTEEVVTKLIKKKKEENWYKNMYV